MEAITAPAPTRATDPIMVVATVAVRIITDLITAVIRVPSLWRWAIGLTTGTGRGITKAAPITFGNQDIGHRGTGSESGSTAITSCDADIRPVQPRSGGFPAAGATGKLPFVDVLAGD